MINLQFTIINTDSSHIILSQSLSSNLSKNHSHHCNNCSKQCTNLSLFNLMSSDKTCQPLYRIPKKQLKDTSYIKQNLVSLSLSTNHLLYLLFSLLFIPLLFFIITLLLISHLNLSEILNHEISRLIIAFISTFLSWLMIKKHIQNTLYRMIKKVK